MRGRVTQPLLNHNLALEVLGVAKGGETSVAAPAAAARNHISDYWLTPLGATNRIIACAVSLRVDDSVVVEVGITPNFTERRRIAGHSLKSSALPSPPAGGCWHIPPVHLA